MKNLASTIGMIILLTLFSYGQSTFGYLGKRVYVNGNISAGPSLLGKNIKGNTNFNINLTGTGSFNFVLNKKNVFEVNYKRYTDIATIRDLYYSALPDPIDIFSSNNSDLGYYRFYTNEVGFSYQFFFKNLDAPLGGYASIGLGFAFSKLQTSYNVIANRNDGYYYDNQTRQREIVSYDNEKGPIISPIIRFGLGKQTVFGKRFFYNYGIDIGINLGGIGSVITPFIDDFIGDYGYYNEIITEDELNDYTKSGIQRRVFMNQLFNFRMGVGMLIF